MLGYPLSVLAGQVSQAASLGRFMNVIRPSGPLLETPSTINEVIALMECEVNYGLWDYRGMPRLRYFVVNNKGRWMIGFQQQHYGPYLTQRQAIDDALSAVRRAKRQGLDAQVLVQNEGSKFRTEWTYGHDQ